MTSSLGPAGRPTYALTCRKQILAQHNMFVLLCSVGDMQQKYLQRVGMISQSETVCDYAFLGSVSGKNTQKSCCGGGEREWIAYSFACVSFTHEVLAT